MIIFIVIIIKRKAFDKIQHPFIIKTPESGYKGNLSQHNKGYIWQTHSKHCSQWWKTENISSKTRNKARMSTLTTIIQHSFGSPSQSNQRREINKWNPNWRKRSKTATVCRWHDTIHRKPLELINEFGKVAGYKLIHRNLLHVYALTMKDQKKKWNSPLYSCIKSN